MSEIDLKGIIELDKQIQQKDVEIPFLNTSTTSPFFLTPLISISLLPNIKSTCVEDLL